MAAPTPAAGRSTGVGTDHVFQALCAVCGESVRFARGERILREAYRCPACGASLRYQGQAKAIVRRFARHGATSLQALVAEPEFTSLRIFEPGRIGPFRRFLRPLRGYQSSGFWPDAAPGEVREGVRSEDLMALTFPEKSFDLVITSDIFEHVRHPYRGFAEVHRVLRTGGAHIFSLPVTAPLRARTVERVDTSGPTDVFLLEPEYHSGGLHLVYNDFGRDMLDRLAEMGLPTEVDVFDSTEPRLARLLTFASVRRETTLETLRRRAGAPASAVRRRIEAMTRKVKS